MINQSLKDRIVANVLPRVQTPGQYLGSELGAVCKDHSRVRGKFCFAFPDLYTIGMSYHGLQVLYAVMNRRDDWACERVFTPMTDMEQQLREQGLPLYSLETFTPLAEFDLIGFTLQHELCYTNVLTMLDLARIPLLAEDRGIEHPLIIAGGPSVANPEPMSRFIDLFILGDGEESLPEVCDMWLDLKQAGGSRESNLAELASRLPYVYVPQLFEPEGDGWPVGVRPTRDDLPAVIGPSILADLESVPLPTSPIVSYVECVQDRITIEIMRGCPGRCRFCQSTTLKRPLRYRSVETIVQAAVESYRNTGYNEISLLSLSTSDYPHFEELITRLNETFRPLQVSISVPSLRINEQWRTIGKLLSTDRRSGLTLAPEVARDDMREQIGKRIKNETLYEGCRTAFENGFSRVKLYFMCGLPGERETDLDGIIEMAETISQLGREVSGRPATVVANVSNFVPKPQTPFQFHAMRDRKYFAWAHEYLFQRKRLRSVQLRRHDIESSLLEGILCRGDRRMGEVIELAWRRGARLDAWNENLQVALWQQALAELNVDQDRILHTPCPVDVRFPWDHIAVHQGRAYLENQHEQSSVQLTRMCAGG